jgi:hypothetical protein
VANGVLIKVKSVNLRDSISEDGPKELMRNVNDEKYLLEQDKAYQRKNTCTACKK